MSSLAKPYAWYNARHSHLGTSLLVEVQKALSRISDGPERYPCITGDVRRILVRRFPYSVYFRWSGATARVIAVVHQHRDPRYWRGRTKG